MNNKKLLTIIVSTALLLYILLRININKLADAFLAINPLYMIVFVIGLGFSWIIKTVEWEQLVVIFSKPKLYTTYLFIVLSNISGKFTPGNLGEFYRGELVHKNFGVPRSKAYSTVLVDKIISFLAIFLIIGFSVIVISSFFTLDLLVPITLTFLLFVIGVVFIILFLFNSKINSLFLRFVPNRYKSFVSKSFENLKNAFNLISSNPAKMFNALILSLLYWVFSCMLSWFLLLGFGYNINIFYVITASLITMLITMIPVTVSGFGAREVSLVFFLEKVNVPAEVTITYSLLSYILNIIALALLNTFLKKDSIKL